MSDYWQLVLLIVIAGLIAGALVGVAMLAWRITGSGTVGLIVGLVEVVFVVPALAMWLERLIADAD